MKRLLAAILTLALLLSLAACDLNDILGKNPTGSTGGEAFSLDTVTQEVQQLIAWGDESAAEGLDRHAVYYYSAAAAGVCALRYLVDNILWLKGEGETVADLSGTRQADWYGIAALNYISPYPLYCQYLLAKMQGKDQEAQVLKAQAQRNPDCPTDDSFYSWKHCSVQELYTIKKALEELEDQVFSCYRPNVVPMDALTGQEYLQEHHLRMAQLCLELESPELALQCAENAINTDPFNGKGYAMGALAAMATENWSLAVDYLNEGFFTEPTCPDINLLMALVAKTQGDREKMSTHLALIQRDQLTEAQAELLRILEGGS